MAIDLVAALEVLRELRQEQIVVTTMGAARQWPLLSQHPLDLHYIPSAMGQAPALGLGLAMAQPAREVIVLNGDGCMLMNLGALITLASAQARNLTLIVLHNGLYEVTGGQRLATQGEPIDFAALARAAKFPSVFSYDALDAWRRDAATALVAPGPRFIELRTAPVGDHYHLESPGPMAERLARFAAALEAPLTG
ncbi:MAG: hypothetical protein K1X74_05320 [Pirellulales bacterium]|nr:hypothetical protein [Pirellulales bacterium]